MKVAEFFTPFQLYTKDLDSILLTTDVPKLPLKRSPKRVPAAKIHRVVPPARRVQTVVPQAARTPKVILRLKPPLNPDRNTATIPIFTRRLMTRIACIESPDTKSN